MGKNKKKDNTQETHFTCKNCNWQGTESELEYDEAESCSGPDKIEVCPVCVSMDVAINFK